MRSTADPSGTYQAKAAQALGALSIGPNVHEVVATPYSTWTVMDLVLPGTPAMDANPHELVNVLRPLAEASTEPGDLPPISAWLRGRLTDGPGNDVDPGSRATAESDRTRALALLDELGADECRFLCHGDAWLGNVLRGQCGLMLIDPRGMSGEVEYDVAVLALKSGRDVRQLAGLLDLDAARATSWSSVARAARV